MADTRPPTSAGRFNAARTSSGTWTTWTLTNPERLRSSAVPDATLTQMIAATRPQACLCDRTIRITKGVIRGAPESDPFASALVVIVVAALTACLIPALRATRTDPILALRG